jgi:hypothetical protein
MTREGTDVSQAAVTRYMLHICRMDQSRQQAMHNYATEVVC